MSRCQVCCQSIGLLGERDCTSEPTAMSAPATDWPSEEAVERAAKEWVAATYPSRNPEWFTVLNMHTAYEAGYRAALATAPSRPVESGWRLLEPGEVIAAGDEYFDGHAGAWGTVEFTIGHTPMAECPIRRRFALPPVAATGGQEAAAVSDYDPPHGMAPLEHAERSFAQQGYTLTAFKYEAAPVGSRDWCLYWLGWWHRSQFAPSSGSTALGDAKDAARYRYINARCKQVWQSEMAHDKGALSLSIDFEAPGEDLGIAIDAAIAALSGEKA